MGGSRAVGGEVIAAADNLAADNLAAADNLRRATSSAPLDGPVRAGERMPQDAGLVGAAPNHRVTASCRPFNSVSSGWCVEEAHAT
jgi:hypothetical protein